MFNNYQLPNSGFNQNQQNVSNALPTFGQVTTNENEKALPTYLLSLLIQMINVLLSQLGFKDRDKITLQALFGLSDGKVEFTSFYQTIAKQIWEREKFSSYFTNSEDHKSTHTRFVRNRLKHIDKKQNKIQIPIIDWTPGNKLKDGTYVPSRFNLYLVGYVSRAWDLAQKEACFDKDPDQAILRAVTKVVDELKANAKETTGNVKKFNLSPNQKGERYFKACVGTMKTMFASFKDSNEPLEAILQKLESYKQTLVEGFESNVNDLINYFKNQEELLTLPNSNVVVESLVVENDYLTLQKKVVKVNTEEIFSDQDLKKEDPTTSTNKLVQNFDNDLEDVNKQKLEIFEPTTPGLEGGEGVKTCTDEHIDVKIPVQAVTSEKEIDLAVTQKTFSIMSLEQKIESLLEIEFSPTEEEVSFSQGKINKFAPKAKKVSRFSYEECFNYAESLKGIHSPKSFAHTIHGSGECDKEIGQFLEAVALVKQKAELEQRRAKQELEKAQLELQQEAQKEKLQDELWEKLTSEEKKHLIKEKRTELFRSNLVDKYRRMPEDTLEKHLIYQIKKDLWSKWEEGQKEVVK